tara:strand:+ start:119 stop:352 length:234 start_codon:yes stop_codon:yes gene_type:complete
MVINYLMSKRVAPTCTLDGPVNNDMSGGGGSTGEAFQKITVDGARCYLTGFSGLTVAGALLLGSGYGAVTIDVSADL